MFSRIVLMAACLSLLAACAPASAPQPSPVAAAASAAAPGGGEMPAINPQDDARFQSVFTHCLITAGSARDCQYPLGVADPVFKCQRGSRAETATCEYKVSASSVIRYRCNRQGGVVHCDKL